MFVNKSVSVEDRSELLKKLFLASEGTFLYCSRLKIEQKPNVDLDFRVNVPGAREHVSPPTETFVNIQKVLFDDFINKIFRNDYKTQFQIMIEITVEFVKSDSNEYEDNNNVEWEREGEFNFGGDGISSEECVEQRSINEYSSYETGATINAS